MRTLSVDLRERILAAYDVGSATLVVVAERFRVSVGMVKKLVQQRRHTGDIRPRHHRSGRKPKILPSHQARLQELLAGKPDLTLAELRTAAGLECTLPAIHYVLRKLDLTYKKRRSAPANKTGRISPGRAGTGGGGNRRWTRPG